jgi:hypothetical protein
MAEITEDNVHDVISYHTPDAPALESIAAVRKATEHLILTILANAPRCADRSAAIRHVRESMMTTNAAIVLGGAV